jgi:hypothetical protein
MLSKVIALARRRLLWNALAFQFAVAVIVALAVLALLLFLGTDIVDPRWLVLSPLASLAAGTWLARRRLPGPYPTAQILDRRLRLTDALSTALFFARPHCNRGCDEGTRQAQHEQAARIAASVDLRQAIPFRFPRAIYLALLPAIVAAGLFHLRYRMDAHLDLRTPMTGVLQQIVREIVRDVKEELAKLQDELKRDDEQERMAQKNKADGAAGDRQPSETADTFAEERQGATEPQAQQEQQASAEQQAGSDPNSPSPRENDGRQQQAAAAQQAGSSSADSSVMSKLRDSMSNLLSLAKPQPGGSGKQQMGKSQDGHPQNSRGEAARDSDSANGEPGEGPPQPGSAKSPGAGQASTPSAEKQPGSSAGNEDGAKDIKEAEQLAAMGKLNAIFGKRSRDLTGQVTAVAPPGPQQLKTSYAQRSAVHNAVQSKVDRDEVSLVFQDYVRRYFELVGKAPVFAKRSDRAAAVSPRRSPSGR